MSLACSRCGRTLQFSGEPPSFCAYCGSPLSVTRTGAFDPAGETAAPHERAAGEPPEAPRQVGGYRVLQPLGAGGMGTVYEAEDAASGRHVALKLIAPEFATSSAAVERFRQEGRLASGIAHPRCVFVLAADEEAGRPYIVMELMPGDTLETLVQRQGPLPPEQAVAKILDVIDGLAEAHRLGVIHRDVKPSNCFLEADGRVKVGDFGLAKSLVNQAHLTKTGTFLGTLLFCSPEQIRAQPVDQQSDVYSVAATLYYLLTGQAPFQGGDAAATLARIVADPAPPMRTLRPDVPAALDRVVLRGLERDRQRRWRSLDEFRAALLPFAPGRLSFGGVGLRFGAYLIDGLVTSPLGFLQGSLVLSLGPTPNPLLWRLSFLAGAVCVVLYFALQEGLWGCTLGKRWLRLRVWKVDGSEAPGLPRALLRTGIWFLLTGAPGQLVPLLSDPQEYVRGQGTYLVVSSLQSVGLIVGVLLLLCTMRARNGYRCLHDILSGTRVVELPQPERRLSLAERRLDLGLSDPGGVAERLGGYVVRGAVARAGAGRVLLGEDPALGRQVLLWLRPADEPPLSPARHDTGRGTRLRWLAAGRHQDQQWDAFLAPSGCPLPELVAAGGKLSWAEARHLLEQLAEELATAGADGTLPRALTVEQVWVRGGGQVLLLDVPLGDSAPDGDAPPDVASLSLLRQVAVLTLEGRPRPADAPPAPIRAPVPGYAARLLARLLGCPPPYQDVGALRAELAAARGRPAEVTRPRRAAHLALLAAFLWVGLMSMTVGGCMSSFVPPTVLRTEDRLLELTREDLEHGAFREFAVGAVTPGPAARFRALGVLDGDLRLVDRLERQRAEARREHDARLEAMSPPMRAYMLAVEAQSDQQMELMLRAAREQQHRQWPQGYAEFFRRRARSQLADVAVEMRESMTLLTRIMTGVVLAWPALWALWAFAVRGGLSFRILGLSLVRADGRPAARWQCAWRALLVWAPVAGLLVASLWLDSWYWSAWYEGQSPVWVLRLGLLAWWAVWPLLAAYVAMALWHPPRAPHDRLAGTYLMPH
jgi:hypothetical protein